MGSSVLDVFLLASTLSDPSLIFQAISPSCTEFQARNTMEHRSFGVAGHVQRDASLLLDSKRLALIFRSDVVRMICVPPSSSEVSLSYLRYQSFGRSEQPYPRVREAMRVDDTVTSLFCSSFAFFTHLNIIHGT